MKIKCTCKHEGQDALHGKQVRVANLTASKANVRARCTVCGKESAPKEV